MITIDHSELVDEITRNDPLQLMNAKAGEASRSGNTPNMGTELDSSYPAVILATRIPDKVFAITASSLCNVLDMRVKTFNQINSTKKTANAAHTAD